MSALVVKASDFWVLAFFVYLYFSSVIGYISKALSMVAFVIVVAGISLAKLNSLRFGRIFSNVEKRRIIAFASLFYLYQVLSLFNSFLFKDVYNVVLLSASLFLFLISLDLKERDFNNILVRGFLVFWLILMVLVAVAETGFNFSASRESFFYPHRNVVAFLAMSSILFLIYAERNIYLVSLYVFLSVFLLLKQDSRGVFICVLVSCLVYRFRFILFLSQFTAFAIFFVTLLIIGVFTYAMASGMTTGELLWLDALVREYSGGGINSGRQLIWPDIANKISESPVFGHGAGYVPSMFLDTDWSSHSLYLQYLLQTGFVGLVLLVSFIYSVYWAAVKRRAYLAASILIGLLFHQAFNVSLFQNNYEQGVLMLIAIGLSLGLSEKNRPKLS